MDIKAATQLCKVKNIQSLFALSPKKLFNGLSGFLNVKD